MPSEQGERGVREPFAAALSKQKFDPDDVGGGREFVHAYGLVFDLW
jgi:hypothetical protein